MHVLLCDASGAILASAERGVAHDGEGQLHRAFSVFVFNTNHSKLLLQKRAERKLFGGLWTNTCCSHLREGETVREAAERRLMEECGFSAKLQEITSFVYRAKEAKGAEYEYDTVLKGTIGENTDLHPDADEVAELQWISLETVQRELKDEPGKYSPWFEQALHLTLV